MAILINQTTRVVIQGITGTVGSFQSKIMQAYGTNIVAGVTPGKGGTSIHGIPVYYFVAEAAKAHAIDAAFGFVPGHSARDAALEVIDAGIGLQVITSEGIPNRDMLTIINHARNKGSIVVGPDTAGIISPGKCKLGVHPHSMYMEGKVGILSKSGALSYEVGKALTESGIGQSTVVGIGGGPFWGLSQSAALRLFQDDPETEVIVMLGEVGGQMEQEAARFIKAHVRKPVIAMIVGRSAPQGAQMGHAGAIVEGREGTAQSKIEALRDAGVHIASRPADISRIIKRIGV